MSEEKKAVSEAIENVKERVIEEEMKESYLDYSMSVIVGRALPDVRDGLKPVHRRILYAMHEMGMTHAKPFKKSARIVGEVLGKYHPHGDQAVYDALVRMVQNFSLRYPLIDGQGNFGSIDGDAPAAMRYTESRLSKIAEEMLIDIEKNTVDFKPNFDASLKEPEVLPSKLPNLLVNGSSGIAVGMATNIPPHNINEICDAIIATIENPNISIEELMTCVKGPDFPTGGIILGRLGVLQSYATGKGSIIVRGKAKIEGRGDDKERIVITEIPYQVNKARLIEEIAKFVREKIIKGITNIRDESDKEGIRIIIDVSQNYPADVVLNQLYKHTQLQTTFGVIMLSLVDGQPKILNLKQMIEEFVKHRKNVVIRRTQFELNEASEKAHIIEGLLVALEDIDSVIKIIKGSDTVEEARKKLTEKFNLTHKQVNAILEMKLQKLTSLETKKLKDEHTQLMKIIAELKEILANEVKVYEIIKKELIELKKKYGDERKTEIVEIKGEKIEDIEDERLIKKEMVVVTISNDDYAKRIPLTEYKKQRRGGKGIIGAKTKEGDIIKDIYVLNTHDYLLCFTSKGRLHWLKAYKIPEATRYARGKPFINILRLEEGEKISDIIPVQNFEEDKFIFFVTKNGIVKKTSLIEFSNPRSCGIIALKLKEGDDLVKCWLTDGKEDIVIATKNGYAIRFNEADVRSMGRMAAGVRGIKLRKGDEVVGMSKVEKDRSLFTLTENGFGKRTKFEFYRKQKRGGKGIKNMKITNKNGCVIGVIALHDNDEIILVSKEGQIIRTFANQIPEIGRATQGVRVMRLNEGDRVVSFARICEENANL
ncbi:MAG: DNA gyrase subunit A [Candidatus Aenigmatarchaeota archaeon]